jgi:hypothetical protein
MDGKGADDRADPRPTNPRLDAVWVSEVGTQLEQHALACRIIKHTKKAFGRSVSPHMFRDAAATSIAVDNPKHIGDAALILGHSGQKMTEKHYNHARSLEASRRHAAYPRGFARDLTGGLERLEELPMRAVIYARYSSDQQRATSIDDQIRLCKEAIDADSSRPTGVLARTGTSASG